jgi:hypothetical protein
VEHVEKLVEEDAAITAHVLIASVTISSVDFAQFTGGERSAVTLALCPGGQTIADESRHPVLGGCPAA